MNAAPRQVIWIDAQMSPMVANWVVKNLRISACSLRKLKLRDATDVEVFDAARRAHAVLLTKDRDLVELVRARGQPPAVIWLRAGNTSNASLCRLLSTELEKALKHISRGEPVVEIGLSSTE